MGAHLLESSDYHGESYNFGPDATVNKSVNELLEAFSAHWQKVKWVVAPNELTQVEHGLLKLCCDKALAQLQWLPTLSFDETVEFTASWYKAFYDEPGNIKNITLEQISGYEQLANKKNLNGPI